MLNNEETAKRASEVAARIRELREISGFSQDEMAKKIEMPTDLYLSYENGAEDLPFSFIHRCAHIFGVDITELLEGSSAKLLSYSVTRKGGGKLTAKEDGIEIKNIAPFFRNKLAEPYWVRYSFSPELQNKPVHLTKHEGQEFDLVLSGMLKVQVGEHTEILEPGDTIFYKSSTPHGMIAVGGEDCVFCAVVLSGESAEEAEMIEAPSVKKHPAGYIYENFVKTVEDERGALQSISFVNENSFNFAFDIVDALAAAKPEKLAMLHISGDKTERRFTFEDMSRLSARAANYFKSLGIKKGDKVMLVLKRHYQFWISVLALHKIGAVAIPATHQLVEHDFEYRFNTAGVSAIVCTNDDGVPEHVDRALKNSPTLETRILVGGRRAGWHDFDEDYLVFRSTFARPEGEDLSCGSDPAVMFFTSGTTGYPKIALHTHKYALGHFITAKYWHCADPDGIHLTISDTGWGKALWGKLYGQWMCETAVFTYDFERFDPVEMLTMLGKYKITTFCAPPTMYRFFIKQDLSKFDLSSIKYATTAGEALNPEGFHQFKKATGLSVMEGFGQTETTLTIANLVGTKPKVGAMGKPSPLYDVDIVDAEGNRTPEGEVGEIVVRTEKSIPCGLFSGYYGDDEKTATVWHDGMYHTGDTAWRDEDGYFWYVGRVDDLIKSSGYRIGPFEIESVIMELPYVLECGVSGVPDEIRGQVVKASVVLTEGTQGTEELKKEIQEYVKKHTAPYKYPRVVVFRDELPKTISGKIQRHLL
ncbi:MAG: AMP-binding protein [Oscillospiraceae bacterium]|nr:AMP-binding protein [Oscillospiraceae bacterium]